MTYTLDYHSRAGLWMLQVLPGGNSRARFYLTRYGAEKVIARYRRMLQSEADREERRAERERESFAQMRYDSYREAR